MPGDKCGLAPALLLAALLVPLLAGCSGHPLAPAPNLYVSGGPAYSGLPEGLKNNQARLLYVTDRQPETSNPNTPEYGFRRSTSAAWGEITVQFGDDDAGKGDDWSALLAASTRPREQRPQLSITDIVERGRFPPTPWPYRVVNGEIVEDHETQARLAAEVNQVQAQLRAMLAQSPRKDVLVFVHGFNNSFNDAALTLAQLWHYLGRTDVPILYSWPAGRGGFGGYAYDRESGEFTSFHLKSFLRALAATPEIERLQLVAHSRGTDVLLTAIKDLIIEARAAGDDPLSRYRFANVVLAAPDLDIEVVTQRMAAERLERGIERLTVYSSSHDTALGLSSWLFSSVGRAGRLRLSDFGEHERRVAQAYDNVDVVRYLGRSGPFTHGYFRNSPAVTSDLIKVIRDDAPPGAEHGRPLQFIDANLWTLDDNYLLDPAVP